MKPQLIFSRDHNVSKNIMISRKDQLGFHLLKQFDLIKSK
jgi:hypothetical protein